VANGAPLETIKAVPAPLRAAYAFALAERTARKLAVPVAASELRPHVARIANGGAAQAEAVIRELMAERLQAEREMAELRARLAAAQVRAEVEQARQQRIEQQQQAKQNAEDRATEALEKAGARLESCRRVHGTQLEVVFSYMGERFISLADEYTLQVIDSGICLGHPPSDRVLTLESLPAVIREAIETDRLVILRAP
jgi:DNA anti-recombination protein RmuC